MSSIRATSRTVVTSNTARRPPAPVKAGAWQSVKENAKGAAQIALWVSINAIARLQDSFSGSSRR